MSDFSWTPTTATSGDLDLRVVEAQFGDGYVQSSGDGIQGETEKWTVVFDPCDQAKLLAIETFIRAKGGWQPFTWTPPSPWNTEISVVCKPLKRGAYRGALRKLTLVFERRY